MTADSLSTRINANNLVGIRVAIIDNQNGDSLEAIAQVIIFPKQKRVLFYFVNTDSFFQDDDEPLIKESPRSADFFSKLTDIKNSYYIHITRENFIRFIDLAGGMFLFFEEPTSFDKSNYSHLQGTRYYSGEQYLEYMLARKTTQPDRMWLNGVDRLQRIESMILNLLWRRETITTTLQSKQLQELALSLLQSNLAKEEMETLLEFVGNNDTHFSMLEVPLKAVILNPKKRFSGKKLSIKEKSARKLFLKYKEDIQTETLKQDDFPVEVLNGTNTKGLARRIKQFLQDQGLRVLDADNYRFKPVQYAITVERSGDTYKAQRLMKLTGIKREHVIFNKEYIDVDASFIIGNDFKIKQLKLK